MKINIDKFEFSDTSVRVRFESESMAETKILYLLVKRVKKVVRTWGYFHENYFSAYLSIPLRKQKSDDDEVSN